MADVDLQKVPLDGGLPDAGVGANLDKIKVTQYTDGRLSHHEFISCL